jgi:putative transposase
VKRLCELGQVSRSGFYRWRRPRPVGAGECALRDALPRVALEFPSYGWPRMTPELRRCGWAVNHKRVYRMMREDNLLCLRRRKFVRTTDSAHPFPVYPNLARGMQVRQLNQLWVADITYIRLRVEFVYLAEILDACSRRVIGWMLGRSLEGDLALQALRRALQQRRPAPGLVHHSDRVVQYASREYTALLEAHEITISMSRKGNPYDNAIAESFMKTLKHEQVYREDYQDLRAACTSIPRFLEQVYNEKRLHSSLGYLPPAEFERALVAKEKPQKWNMIYPARRAAR